MLFSLILRKDCCVYTSFMKAVRLLCSCKGHFAFHADFRVRPFFRMVNVGQPLDSINCYRNQFLKSSPLESLPAAGGDLAEALPAYYPRKNGLKLRVPISIPAARQ